MASYIDIRTILFSDDALRNRVDVATMIAANNTLAGTPTVDQQKWAASVFSKPSIEGEKAFRAILAEFNTLDISAIQGASDAAVQSAVDNIVDTLVIAFNANLGV